VETYHHAKLLIPSFFLSIVWNTMLGHYQRHMIKLANVMTRWKTILSTTQNDLLHEFIDKKFVSFCNRFQSRVTATAGHW